jgi:two-component system OmpR family response regulator/two-component system alkaline phosphatase synthesis response regulator PhoP
LADEDGVQGARILVIDDDRETRWTLATVLRREGAAVTEASNGEEGLRVLLQAQHDLIVSDVCMPGLGGFGLFAALRFSSSTELDACRAIPVILLSGQVPSRDLAQALDAGVDDIMEKPADPAEFKSRVRAALRRARMSVPKARTHGDLADFGMASLAQALHHGARSVRVELQSGSVLATLDFRSGQIGHALYEEPGVEFRGDDAAVRALCLANGVFQLLPLPDTSPHTVFTETSVLLLRAAAHADETTVEAGAAPEAVAAARAAAAADLPPR